MQAEKVRQAMIVLAIETATVRQSAALVQDGQVLATESHAEPGSHARWLMPAIDRLLRTTGLSLAALDAFVVSQGPGSFTGLRVGLATVLGFRAVTGRPIVTVGTLDAMAWGVHAMRHTLETQAEALPICAMLPCRKGEVFWAQYERAADGALTTRVAPHVGAPEALADTIERPTLVLGDGWAEVQAAMRATNRLVSDEWQEVPEALRHPSAVTLAQVGMERLRRGELAEPVIAPLYVQRAEAELKQGAVESKSSKIMRGAMRSGRAARAAAKRA